MPPTKCPPASIVGYTISQNVTVKVRNFANIGDIMSGVTERGVNDLSGLSFVVHDRAEIENEARAKAIAEAKKKAQDLAKAGNFRLGRILSIQEGSQPYYAYNRALEVSGKGGADMALPAPAIEPGSEEITQNVTITYEIR